MRSDVDHAICADAFRSLLQPGTHLITSSYVRHELISLLHARVGIPSVVAFQGNIEPWLSVIAIDEALHSRALSALVASGRRRVSLTDWSSFELMRSLGLTRAFAIDRHFEEQGFDLIPRRGGLSA